MENKSGNKNQTWNACGAWCCLSRNIFIIIINRIFQGEKTGEKEQESTCVVGSNIRNAFVGGGGEDINVWK